MRKLLFASVIALASGAALASPADAHVFFGIGGGYFGFGPFGDFYDNSGPYPFYGPYYGGPYYDHYGSSYSGGYDGGYVAPYPHRYYAYRHDRHCRTEFVRHWRNHHWVGREISVCGY